MHRDRGINLMKFDGGVASTLNPVALLRLRLRRSIYRINRMRLRLRGTELIGVASGGNRRV